MPDFTYTLPNESRFMRSLLMMMTRQGHVSLYERLQHARCAINTTNDFSRVRWNAFAATVIFQLPPQEFAATEIDDHDKRILLKICNEVMPPSAGYDIKGVGIAPLLEDIDERQSIEDELHEIAERIASSATPFPLPHDILAHGKTMSEVYLYLYAVENYLRLFIERVGTDTYGTDYFQKLTILTRVQRLIESRKDQEAKNQWIVARRGSDLFYLDFKEVADVIENNWPLFSSYFPNITWIKGKIEELGNARNLVAHNSLVSEDEIDLIRTYFRNIVRQLNR